MHLERTLQPNKILVVDDEVSMVQVCQLILQEAGHKVRGAVSGRQALRMIDEEMPDFILLDIMMPGMNGIEVCRLIRQHHPSPHPVIVMYTADGRAEVKAESLAVGADACITKQNPFHDLPQKINPYLIVDYSAVA
ncbi:MAG: response regulator [Ardenticatenaceae bacterium]|nr:response regulator [Ardenticatenaceae bacterium]MCB9445446.1 response regulator [Ardenticatenaceae bacterium]